MNAIITGMNGTVAPVLAEHLVAQGVDVVPWDREKTPTDDRGKMEDFITGVKPSWFFHVATGDPRWAESLAGICSKHAIKFLFTSSVSVFSSETKGPFTMDSEPDATDDYGQYKMVCEELVSGANSDALIARLGWQIGAERGTNNMMDYLFKMIDEHGHVEASTRWFPACSFLGDTADALIWLMENGEPGIYHLDGNPNLSFFKILTGLKALHGEAWTIIPTEEPVIDNRMSDDRIRVMPITKRLP